MDEDTYLKFKKEFEEHEKTAPLFRRAEKLIAIYRKTSLIPVGELDNIPAGYNEIDLLSCCMLAEKRQNQNALIQ
jgi:hypothetical protein